MAVINTGSYPKALWPGINAWWGEYQKHPLEYPLLFEMDDSDKNYEEDVEGTGFGLAPVKPEGSSIYYDADTQGYVSRYQNVTYALGYIITMEAMQDDQYMKVGKARTRKLSFSMRTSHEIVAANVYNRGFNNSFAGGDGVSLFNAAHPTMSGTQSNVLPVAADISQAAIEDMLTLVNRATNTRGLPVAIHENKLVVSPGSYFEAMRILGSTLQNDTGNNAINTLKGMFPGGVVMNHYLTDLDAWFITTTAPEGLKHFQRMALEFNQDNDGDTRNAKYTAVERYSVGWTDWRGAFGSPGA